VIVIASGGLGAAEAGGPIINVIPRSGGNTPAGSFYYNFSNDALQGNNINDDLKAQNPALASAAGSILKTQDINIAYGGPIKWTGSGTSAASGTPFSTRASRASSTTRIRASTSRPARSTASRSTCRRRTSPT
jgi:hypothetical protein